MPLRVCRRGGTLAARARISAGSLRGAGRAVQRAAASDGAGEGVGEGAGTAWSPAGIGSGAEEGDDVYGSVPLGKVSKDEAPPDKDSPGGMSRSFLVTSRICSSVDSISGPPSTLSALACSAGMLTLKSRTVV